MELSRSFRALRSFLGEFAVIVTGVLVALAVSQWNDGRNDRLLEKRYLERLKADLQSDTTNFGDFDRRWLHTKADVLRDLLPKDALRRLAARPALIEDLSFSRLVALPANRPATFEELRSTGRLSLIRDVDLRGALSNYYSGFDHISRIYAVPYGDYRKRLEANLPGPAFYDWRLKGIQPDTAALMRGLANLVGEPGLDAAVNSELAYTATMTFYLREYHRQAADLLRRLERHD